MKHVLDIKDTSSSSSLVKKTTSVSCESRLLRLMFTFIVRQRPLVAVGVITAAEEEVSWHITVSTLIQETAACVPLDI